MEETSVSHVEGSVFLCVILVSFMPWPRWLICGLSLCRSAFYSMPVRVGFMVGKVTLGQLVSSYVSFSVILQCYILIFMLILPLS
jgi:hypothetical protein